MSSSTLDARNERLGARIGPVLPESLRITGSVAEWTSWTGLAFPVSGSYVFPEGLAPVEIDVCQLFFPR